MTNKTDNTQPTPAFITAYEAAKRATAALKAAGVEGEVRPQMMYNYTTAKLRAGKKPLIASTLEDGVSVEAFDVWVATYVGKKVAALTQAAAETVAAE